MNFKEYITDNVNEALNVSHYNSKEYKDYEYGTPVQSATDAEIEIKKIEESITQLNKLSKNVGPALSSGFKKAIKKDIDNIISKNLK